MTDTHAPDLRGLETLMPMNSRSVRAGIDAMLGAQSSRHHRCAAAEAGTQATSVIESDVLLARSGYIVVAG